MELVTNEIIPREYRTAVTTFLTYLEPGETVLVLGASETELLNKFRDNGFHVICVEQDPELCKKWQAEGIEMIQGTFRKLASTKVPNELHGIWGGTAFEHMSGEDFEHTLEIIHMMLPEQGVLFLTVPRKSEHGESEIMQGASSTHFFTEEELTKILKEKDFEIKLIEESTPKVITAVAVQSQLI